MKQLSVKKLQERPLTAGILPKLMDDAGIEYQTIGHANWSARYPYTPQVIFRMAYADDALYLHYRVREDSVRALATHDNGRVWEDSCCEFFSQPADDGTYYNIECNCGGTLLVGRGPGREHRTLAPQAVLDNVSRWTSFGRRPFEERIGDVDWQLALIIPRKTFFMHNDVKPLQGRTIRANFYKCGDALRQPHFLSWSPIHVKRPDFHRPDFFGEITFE